MKHSVFREPGQTMHQTGRDSTEIVSVIAGGDAAVGVRIIGVSIGGAGA